MISRPVNWLIGCSGFSYRDWKPVFYPEGLPSRKWLEFYCSHFNTLETNTTFYRTPKLETLRNWHSQTPEGFVFAVKAPRLITHFKKFVATEDSLAQFYDLMLNGLQEKLGCILFQFPPMYSYTEQRLAAIVSQLDKAFTNVVEFRHRSWWNYGVYAALGEAGISFCGISHPDLPDDVIPGFSTQYYRFHGVPDLYRSPYADAYLEEIVSRIEASPETRTAYVFFNNTIAATAIANAQYTRRITALHHLG